MAIRPGSARARTWTQVVQLQRALNQAGGGRGYANWHLSCHSLQRAQAPEGTWDGTVSLQSLMAWVSRCLSQCTLRPFKGFSGEILATCTPASEPNTWVRLRLFGATSGTAHKRGQLASTSEDTSQAEEMWTPNEGPHKCNLIQRRRPPHPLAENQNAELGPDRSSQPRGHAWACTGILGSAFPTRAQWSLCETSLLPRAHVLCHTQHIFSP